MKFAAIIDYANDPGRIDDLRATHRAYLRGLLDTGRLAAAGPREGHAGALWVFDAETPQEADELVRGNPYRAAGVITGWRVLPLAYWSAKACTGER